MNTDTEQENIPQVTVYHGPTQLETEMVRGSLLAAGIPAAIGEQVTEAYAPTFSIAEGYWGTITVPAPYEAQAQAVLAALAEGKARVSDEELESAAMDTFDPRV